MYVFRYYTLKSCHISQGHYDDVKMGAIASQITSLTIVYSTVYSGADQSKHQSSASLAFVWGIHRGPVNSPHKWPVTRKMFPFDDVIMTKESVTGFTCTTRVKSRVSCRKGPICHALAWRVGLFWQDIIETQHRTVDPVSTSINVIKQWLSRRRFTNFNFHLLKPSNSSMRSCRPLLVQITACRLFGTKLLCEPMLAYCLLDLCEETEWHSDQNTNYFIEENAFENAVCKISAILPWPQCPLSTWT